MTSFLGNVNIEQVVNSLDAFKKAIYNVNYVNKLIFQNKNSIIEAGQYASIIEPYIVNKYINNDVDISIGNVALNKNKWSEGKIYYETLHPSWNNQPLSGSNLNAFTYNNVITQKTSNAYNMIRNSIFQASDYLNKVLAVNPNSKIIYQCYVKNWINGVELVVKCIQKDILDETKWINVLSSVTLSNYFLNTDNLSIFSKEYITFGNIISQLIFDLESANWNNSSLIKNIWEYSNISEIGNTKCLYSEKYPNWNGKMVTECFVPNSNIDIKNIIIELLNDLYFYYPSLSIGELAFSSYNLSGNNILSVCKIDTYNGINCIKEVQINLQLFFTKNNIIGDTIIGGNLNMKNANNENIIQTDNVNKNISIHGKIGINQELFEIKGLLDIDNLSNENILTIINKISILNNT